MAAKRDPWLDNAKFWLVGLVVVGHALVLAPSSELRNQTYDFVYTFHMPAFIMLSGYLSRRFRWTRRHLVALVTTLLVPYFFFELSMALWRVHVAGTVDSMADLAPLWWEPHWPTWFLVVLAMWRLATPVLVKHWAMVPLSFAVSLLAGAYDFTALDGNRFLGMLPFFVVGLHLPDLLMNVLRSRWSPVLGLGFLGWLWWASYGAREREDIEWFYYRSAYETMNHSFDAGVLERGQLLVLGVLGAFAFLTLVPRGKHFFTAMGAASMTVYLFHGFVVQWAKGNEWREHLPEGDTASVVTVVVCSLALAMLLGSPWVARWLNLLADPWNQVVAPALARLRRGRSEQAPGRPAEAATEADPR